MGRNSQVCGVFPEVEVTQWLQWIPFKMETGKKNPKKRKDFRHVHTGPDPRGGEIFLLSVYKSGQL